MRAALWTLAPLLGCPVSVDTPEQPTTSAPEAAQTAADASGADNAGGGVATAGNRASPSEPQGTAPSPQGGARADSTDAPAAASVPIRIDVSPPAEEPPRYTQDALRRQAAVTFSGMARCDGCADALVLRVVPFQDPSALGGAPAGPLTALTLSRPGPFRLLVPKVEQPIVLELLVDSDGNGAPSRGERMAVIVEDGALIPREDRTDLLLDASEVLVDPMLVGPGGGGR